MATRVWRSSASTAVSNIFDVWQDDQFDFHAFSLRKGMIRAYVDLVRWEDRIREHPFFTRAALDAARLYVSKFDRNAASGANGAAANGANGANGAAAAAETPADAAEKKKAAKKAKKEAQKAEKEAAEKAARQDPNKSKPAVDADGEPKKKDDDPLGLKLAATTDPLGEATKFIAPALQFSPKSLDAQLVGFDVYLRRSKFRGGKGRRKRRKSSADH